MGNPVETQNGIRNAVISIDGKMDGSLKNKIKILTDMGRGVLLPAVK